MIKQYDPSTATNTCFAIKSGDPIKVFKLIHGLIGKITGVEPDVSEFNWKLSFSVFSSQNESEKSDDDSEEVYTEVPTKI